MGWILSKFRKSKSTMEVLTKLEAEINGIIEFKACTAQTQKRVVGYLVTYSIVIYLLVAIFAYFKLFPAARTAKDQLFLLLPFLVSPLLIWGLRRFLTWYYHRKIVNNDKKLVELRKNKSRLLDEVMETETYKVAKEILDKFGDKTQSAAKPLAGVSAVTAIFNKGPSDNQLRRRTIGDPGLQGRPSLNQSLPASASSRQAAPHNLNQSVAGVNPGLSKINTNMTVGPPMLGSVGGPNSASAQPGSGNSHRQQGQGQSIGGRPGPPLPRPILPRERGYLDKFVEFLVGDGPANRYALICRQCESHNGMALREEFEYIAFRCCYCYYWNPARKQRPVAPRLAAAAEKPTGSSNNSESSSGSDESSPSSRRPSVSKKEEKFLNDDEEKARELSDLKTKEEYIVVKTTTGEAIEETNPEETMEINSEPDFKNDNVIDDNDTEIVP